MKKIFFLLAFVLGCVSSQAQVIKVYENGTLVNTYTNGGDKSYKVVVSKGPGDVKTHEVVDLGLSVKWATCNVGAETAYDTGDYFAWGETSSKSNYSWDTYKYGTYDNLTRYNSTDGNTVLKPEDDAATVNWGTGYRMPTQEEFEELVNKCTWNWDSAHNGYLVAGSNGNSIFLPASGFHHGSDLNLLGSNGFYWSSTLFASDRNIAYDLELYSDYRSVYVNYRYFGFPVRPVAEP